MSKTLCERLKMAIPATFYAKHAQAMHVQMGLPILPSAAAELHSSGLHLGVEFRPTAACLGLPRIKNLVPHQECHKILVTTR